MAEVRKTKRFLLKCTNSSYVSDQDKVDLRRVEAILDRSHLTYLMEKDPELLKFKKRVGTNDCPIYMNRIEYSFGLLSLTIDQVIKLD